MTLFSKTKKPQVKKLGATTQLKNITFFKRCQAFFKKTGDSLIAKVFGEDIFDWDYKEEYIYTYTIDLDKDEKTVCKIYDFEKYRKANINGNIKRNIKRL